MKKTIFTFLVLIGTGLLADCQAQTDPLSVPLKIKIKTHIRLLRHCEHGPGLCVEFSTIQKPADPIIGFTSFEGTDYLIISRAGLDEQTIEQFENTRLFPIDEDLYLAPEQLQSIEYKGGIFIHKGNYAIRNEDNCILIPVKFEYQ